MIVIVPSRGRPGNIAELIECWRKTDAIANLWVCVDDDDPELDGYRSLDLGTWGDLIVGPRLRLGGTLNLAAQFAAATGDDVVGFMGDDHRPRSLSWDDDVADQAIRADGRPAVVYGNDLVQGQALPTAVFMDARIIRTLGYMVPPGMVHLYLDNFWKLLGERLGTLTYLPDVVIEHLHPTAGTAEWDDGYREVNDSSVYNADKARLDEYLATQFETDVAKLEALR